MSAITGPIPAYSNVPIEPQFYKPSMFFISAISLGVTTIVNTAEDNNYVIGQQVRLIIPFSFGCRELNNQTGFVISIPQPNQVEIDIFSVGMNAFIASSARTKAQILAIGDNNNGNSGVSSNFAPAISGSFVNISPN